MATFYLLLPQIPMLFMGGMGCGATLPVLCDFGPELAAAVRKGWRQEFARFPEFQDPAVREMIPAPTAEATFLAAKLAWHDREREPHAEQLARYSRLLHVRRREIEPTAIDALLDAVAPLVVTDVAMSAAAEKVWLAIRTAT